MDIHQAIAHTEQSIRDAENYTGLMGLVWRLTKPTRSKEAKKRAAEALTAANEIYTLNLYHPPDRSTVLRIFELGRARDNLRRTWKRMW